MPAQVARQARSAAIRSTAAIDVRTIVDLDRSGFLTDHVVRGSVILPTALQIEIVVASVSPRLTPGVGLSLSDIAVQDTAVLVAGSPYAVRVVGALPTDGPDDAPGALALHGPAGARCLALHAATLASETGANGVFGGGALPALPEPGDLVYPPMFHGPAFQVVDRFGRDGDRLVSALAGDLPSWDLTGRAGGRVAQLVELLLQSCGVWELTETGRMMRPARIDRLEISPHAADALTGVWAEVWPTARNPSAFDGVVRDGDGRACIRVRGYRPVELDPPHPGVLRARAPGPGSPATH